MLPTLTREEIADLSLIHRQLLTIGARLAKYTNIHRYMPNFRADSITNVMQAIILLIECDFMRWDDTCQTFKCFGNGGVFDDVSPAEWQGVLNFLAEKGVSYRAYEAGSILSIWSMSVEA